MKACLMKLNYDPKYTTPHLPPRASENLHSRFSLTKQIYGKSNSDKLPTTHAKKPPDITFRSLKQHPSNDKKKDAKKSEKEELAGVETISLCETRAPEDKSALSRSHPLDRHKAGIAKAHSTVKLVPLKSSSHGNSQYSTEYLSWMLHQSKDDGHIGKMLHGPYSDKLPRRSQTSSHSQSSFHLFQPKRTLVNPPRTTDLSSIKDPNNHLKRSKTVPPMEKMRSPAVLELERRARVDADRAVKEKKIFSIHGPYPSLRAALRRRGWVEKFNQSVNDACKKHATDPDDELIIRPSRGKENNLSLWQEENGYYAMMSHLVRNSTPTFVFTVKSADVDSRVTKSGQLVNHFGKARTFTTKTGLCQHMHSVPWYECINPDTFYPRSYKMEDIEEREAFVDDYHLNACVSFIKQFVARYKYKIPEYEHPPDPELVTSGTSISVSGQLPLVTVRALELAVQQCQRFLRFKSNDDIDDMCDEDTLSPELWEQFLVWYYNFVHDEYDVCPVTEKMVQDCKELLITLEDNWCQYNLDGDRNVWILKPGAKSRGRGIQCVDRLDMIIRLCEQTEGSLVVQKYIERPLLVYRTKFDIRQWFLVTDWNPLTIWFYMDSYLRFCSQEFTLHNFHVSIHLSNNSIQKNCQHHGYRSENLPKDQMWTSTEFDEYLKARGHGDVWKERVYPGMKRAITCALLCTQEFIEYRKSAFELYGADFMLTEDMQPWLLEINCSPSMAQNTRATSTLVDNVLEDTLKVVLDKRLDKNADTGRFEIAYKQAAISDPPPFDQSLMVNGRKIRKRQSPPSPNKR